MAKGCRGEAAASYGNAAVNPAGGEGLKLSPKIPAFNAAFHSVAGALTQCLGAPGAVGDRRLSFRTWSYAYKRWSLPEGEFTLVQDEFDIQEGPDVTLWIQPVGTPIEKTLRL